MMRMPTFNSRAAATEFGRGRQPTVANPRIAKAAERRRRLSRCDPSPLRGSTFRFDVVSVGWRPRLNSARPSGAEASHAAIFSLLILLALLGLPGCDMLDMYDEPRFEPLEASTFFDDGTSARPLVAGTVARGDLREDEAFYSGKVGGKYVTELPLDLNRALLVRGQERFNIYCSPCHGQVGDGNGMIVQRGFRRPPSFVSTDRLLNAPVGHFYDVISNGFGAMPSYASRVAPHDRWAIVAYIRALQRSQNGSVDDVPPELRDKIAESEAVQEQAREKREAAERLDTERQRKLERDIREHRVPPQEGERRHRELERKKREGEKNNRAENLRLPPALAGGWQPSQPALLQAGFSRASRHIGMSPADQWREVVRTKPAETGSMNHFYMTSRHQLKLVANTESTGTRPGGAA